jgi:hypothetical protein
VPVRTAVHIMAFWTLLDEKGNLKTETLEKNTNEMIDQVLWYAKVLKEAKK